MDNRRRFRPDYYYPMSDEIYDRILTDMEALARRYPYRRDYAWNDDDPDLDVDPDGTYTI